MRLATSSFSIACARWRFTVLIETPNLGFARLAQVQVGIGTDEAGGEARGDVLRVEIGCGGCGRSVGLSAEIEVLGLGDVALGALLHGFDGPEVRARDKRRVDEGHERMVFQ